MRVTALVLSVLAAMAAAEAAPAAPVFDDPRGLVEYVYLPYTNGTFPEDAFELYSPSLVQLWQDMEQRRGATATAPLGFDPLVNGQDFDIDDLAVTDPAIRGDWATVTATFTNFGVPQELRFTLVRRAEGWKIDDIESLAGDEPWRLSELLAADPLLN
ncbi:hypothetical protein [Devosia sp.]|uniref:hypothetical protein n=1 Tax=Devosia sp. TaxID=1871048 RepID=UPI002F1F7192